MTCADSIDPACFPTRLREADTVVQPLSACPVAVPEAELCVGSRDGGVAAGNMDSGGPALVRDGGRWALAGVVSGPGGDNAPTLYTDVTRHADWINGIITGPNVPPTTGSRTWRARWSCPAASAGWSAPPPPARGTPR